MEIQENSTGFKDNNEITFNPISKKPGFDLPLILWGWVFLFVSLTQYVIKAEVSSEQIKTILNISGLLVGLSAIILSIHFVVNRRPISGKERVFKYYWLVVFILYHIIPFFIDSNFADYQTINVYRLTFVGMALIGWGIINNFVWLIYGGALFAVAPLFINQIYMPYQHLAIASLWLFAYIFPFFILLNQKKSRVLNHAKLDPAMS